MSKKEGIELTSLEREWATITKVLGGSGVTFILAIPDIMEAAPKAVEVGKTVGETGNAFDNVYTAIMNAFDEGVVIVIIFAAGCWCLGHRTKSIEMLIGCCIGYLIARHARELRDFLKKI